MTTSLTGRLAHGVSPQRGTAALLLSLVLAGAAGCVPEGRGFKLPDGDLADGRQTFVDLGCHDCHRVADIARNPESQMDVDIALGGEVNSVKTYGELVTSIINPSHVIARPYPPQPVTVDGSESAMRRYNGIMTVQQLVDLVTFLETEYELRAPPSYM